MTSCEGHPARRAVFLRWGLCVVALLAWLAVMRVFPLYFQRDEVQMMNWVRNHGPLDGFIPTRECGFSHDSAYRPLIYTYWWLAYSAFGLNYVGHYLVTGVLFLLCLVSLFRLVRRVSDDTSAWAAALLWPVAFQFLLTVLFWATQQTYLAMVAMVLFGLDLFVAGLGRSPWRVAFGCFVMFASTLFWESLSVIAGTAAALHVLTQGSTLGWNRAKTLGYSLITLTIGPLYWVLFPYGKQRVESSSSPLIPSVPEALERLHYYAQFITSGYTGLLLLIPAFYCIAARILRKRRASSWAFPISVALSIAVSMGTAGLHLWYLGIAAIVIGCLVLPRKTYLFLALAFVPLVGLVVFPEVRRTYLFVPSFALAAMAGIQTCRLASEIAEWWGMHVRSRILGYVALVLLTAGGIAAVAPAAKEQVALLRFRSDITQTTKGITKHLQRLPRGAYVVNVDYGSMGVRFSEDALRWTDRQKLEHESPVDHNKAQYWFNDIGRPDLKSISFAALDNDPARYKRAGHVYVWLETVADHRFFAARHLDAEVVVEVRRGGATATLLRLK